MCNAIFRVIGRAYLPLLLELLPTAPFPPDHHLRRRDAMSELRRSSRNKSAMAAESSAPAPAAKRAPPKKTRKGAKSNDEVAAAGPVAAESAPTAESTSSSAEVSTPATHGSNAKGKGKAPAAPPAVEEGAVDKRKADFSQQIAMSLTL